MERLLKLFFLTALTLLAQHPPTGPESGMPNFTKGPDGSVYLSWIDTLGTEGHALRFSQWKAGQWTPPETIAKGKGWFVNWADFPALSVMEDGSMLAHWLTRFPAGGTHGYGIRIANRAKGESTWRETHSMKLDEKNDYAGFLSFESNRAIYLAPPTPNKEGHRKTVRLVTFNDNGKPLKDLELDADACSCCQTAIGKTTQGWIAAYRDHQPGEIRDIAIVRERNGIWSKPQTLHPDGWKINGCPTDGPSIATHGNAAAIAWLTRADDSAKVRLMISRNEGTQFGDVIQLDDGNPLGRPSLTTLGHEGILAVWLEKLQQDKVEIRMRRIAWDGTIHVSQKIAEAPLGRTVGFPRVVVSGKDILVAWRDGGIRVATLKR